MRRARHTLHSVRECGLMPQLGQIRWDLSHPLQKAYEFFLSGSQLSMEIDELLYLFREAGEDKVPLRVSLLTICTLYESLMRSIHAHRLKSLTKSDEIVAFTEAKTEVLKHIQKRQDESQVLQASAFSRLFNNYTALQARASGRLLTPPPPFYGRAAQLTGKPFIKNGQPTGIRLATRLLTARAKKRIFAVSYWLSHVSRER